MAPYRVQVPAHRRPPVGDDAQAEGSIGPLLAELRVERGLSQLRLAERLCAAAGVATVSRCEVSRWERGLRVPGSFWLGWLAAVLEVPPHRLSAARPPRPPGHGGPAARSTGRPGRRGRAAGAATTHVRAGGVSERSERTIRPGSVRERRRRAAGEAAM
jgi:transcriptional regulator with XRE-family HTH domain